MATPEGRDRDSALPTRLVQYLAAAVALVVAVSAAFWVVGQIRGDGENDVVVAEPTDDTGADPRTDTEPEDSTPADDGTATATTAPTATETTPPATATDDGGAGEGDEGDGGTQVAPAEISVQVLDAVIDDGGAAADRVAERLEADGYEVIAVNRAVRRYDLTTVFYTAGNDDAARQVAEVYGFTVVEEQPGNLSEEVDVHIVVGADDA